MRQLLLALLLGLSLPTLSVAQTALMAVDYDLDATTETYTCYRGAAGRFFDSPKPGRARIETSSSSATVTGVNADLDVFADLGVGDLIYVAGTYRVITAKASADSITVNAAIDLDITGGYTFTWRDFESGTGADTCWIPTQGHSTASIVFALDQYVGDGNGLDWRVVCRGDHPAQSVLQVDPVTPGTYNNETSTTVEGVKVSFDGCKEFRVGILHNTADDGDDLTTNAEQVNIFLTLGDEVVR